MKCLCGCGNNTNIVTHTKNSKGIKKGDYRKYILGHHTKGSNHGGWKGGKCNNNGYVMILIPAHPFCDRHGYVREHRLVMEKKICRFLQPKEQVHHINGVKDDNRISNLILTNIHEHTKLFHPDVLKKNQYKLGYKAPPRSAEYRKKISDHKKLYWAKRKLLCVKV